MADSAVRRLETAVFGPPARLLLKARLTPNMVTVGGTVIVVAAALALFPTGHLLPAIIVIAVCGFADSLDGTMARLGGRQSTFGAFLDSTLDRLGDGAVFGGIALWFFGRGDSFATGAAALACLVLAFTVSYARSRAENFGYDAHVGLAERTPRLVVTLAVMLAVALGAPTAVATWGLIAVAAFAALTALQRILAVRRQAMTRDSAGKPLEGEG